MADFNDRMDYIRKLFAPDTALRTDGDISIFPEEGKLLQLLIRLGGIKKIVEIGTFGGYSARWMADALPEDGHIITIEKDPQRAVSARTALHGNTRVTLMEGDALDILPTLSGPFDMVFIDADKLNYIKYLDWAENNVRKGGLVIGDNTFLFDAVWKDGPIERVRETARQAMREFNLRLSHPDKYCGIMLPTTEGLTIAQKLF